MSISASLRERLLREFDDQELQELCWDFYRPVADQFSTSMTKGQKVQLLLEYVERRSRTDELVDIVERLRPRPEASLDDGDLLDTDTGLGAEPGSLAPRTTEHDRSEPMRQHLLLLAFVAVAITTVTVLLVLQNAPASSPVRETVAALGERVQGGINQSSTATPNPGIASLRVCDSAVVLPYEVLGRTAPSVDAEVAVSLTQAETVEIVCSSRQSVDGLVWVQVRTVRGSVVWVPQQDLVTE